jgi:hypothetical protein
MLKEIAGEPPPPRVNPFTVLKEKLINTTGKLAHAEERLAAADEEPPPFIWLGDKADRRRAYRFFGV